MKKIIKTQEPRSLIQHRVQPHSFFDNLPIGIKEDIRNNLLEEQGYICCYCMKRIPEKINDNGKISYDMKIEHFQCQNNFSNLRLEYKNLLGACTGNMGKSKRLQTCDTFKGESLDLTINPSSDVIDCETLFKYNSEGEISSITNDENINKQINKVLNLNMQTLKDNRKQVYLEVQRKIEMESKQKPDKKLKISYFEQEKIKWVTKNNDGKYKEFCMVAVYYLNKKIRQNSI
jgi:uncharacterized protein (TIGR02646 family)